MLMLPRTNHVQGVSASLDSVHAACGLLILSLVTPTIYCSPYICRRIDEPAIGMHWIESLFGP